MQPLQQDGEGAKPPCFT